MSWDSADRIGRQLASNDAPAIHVRPAVGSAGAWNRAVIALVFGFLLLAGSAGAKVLNHVNATTPQSAATEVHHVVAPLPPAESESYQTSNNDDVPWDVVSVAGLGVNERVAIVAHWRFGETWSGLVPGISRGRAPPAFLTI